MKIAGFVPAKANSNRVPRKNSQEILGVPLFLWAANNLNRVLDRADIYIDSDSQEMREMAEGLGFCAIARPDALATNATNGNEFMLWQSSQVDADIYVQHLAPMPFLREETLKKAIAAVSEGGYASAIGVLERQHYYWKDGKPAYDIAGLPNSVELPKSTIEGMGLYVVRKDALLNQRVRAAHPCAHIKLDSFEAIDIDYPDDLALARATAKGLDQDSDYVSGIREIFSALKNIKLVVLDVDGVMTDGGMYYSENGDQLKKFNAKDGMAIASLKSCGIDVAFLSSGYTKAIIPARAKTLGVERLYVGREKKLDILGDWLAELKLDWEQVAYIGDDINDLHVIEKVGLSACPADAVANVRKSVHIQLEATGGNACVREFADTYLLKDKML